MALVRNFQPIEDFFLLWFQTGNSDRLSVQKKLYRLLLTAEFQKKVILSDDALKKIHSSDNLSPYLVRLFLHAIVIKPSDWSPLFATAFKEALLHADTLNHPTYPQELLHQLAYLQRERETDTPGSYRRKRIVLPHHVKSFEDINSISPFFTESEFCDIYQKNKVLFDPLISRKIRISNIYALKIPCEVLHQCILDTAKFVILNTSVFQTYLLFFMAKYPEFDPANFIEEVLSKCGSSINVNQKLMPPAMLGNSLCHFFASRNDLQAVRVLVNHEANIAQLNNTGIEPVTFAKSREMVSLLSFQQKPLKMSS